MLCSCIINRVSTDLFIFYSSMRSFMIIIKHSCKLFFKKLMRLRLSFISRGFCKGLELGLELGLGLGRVYEYIRDDV